MVNFGENFNLDIKLITVWLRLWGLRSVLSVTEGQSATGQRGRLWRHPCCCSAVVSLLCCHWSPGCGCPGYRELMCRGLKELLLPSVPLSLTALLLSLVLLPTLPALLVPAPVPPMPWAPGVPGWFCRQAAAFRFRLFFTCSSFALGLRLKFMEPRIEDNGRYFLSSSSIWDSWPWTKHVHFNSLFSSSLEISFPQRLFLPSCSAPPALETEHKHLNLRMNII